MLALIKALDLSQIGPSEVKISCAMELHLWMKSSLHLWMKSSPKLLNADDSIVCIFLGSEV